MKREDLKAIEGLTDDQINAVLNLHKKDVISWNAKLDDKTGELKKAAAKVAELQTSLDTYKDVDIDGLRSAKDTYDAEKAKLIADHEKALNDMKFNSALELKIRDTKTVDPIALKAHLDVSTLKYDEKTKSIEGFDDQVKSLKESYAYLFGGRQTGNPHGGISGSGIGDADLSGALHAHYGNKS